MSASPVLLLGPVPIRAPDVAEREPSLTVLIRVPALPDATPQTTAWRRDRVRRVRLIPRPHAQATARRRRLRREFRMAGSAALCLAPVLLGLAAFWGPRPSADAATSAPEVRVAAPIAPYAIRGYDEMEPEPEPLRPLATISFEPVQDARPVLAELPEVRPAGYLLPDDGPMESVNEGR